MSINPYESPQSEPSPKLPTAPGRNWNDYSAEYNAAFWTALKLQGVLAILAALMLDFGQAKRAYLVAFLCQWATVWIILFRRPMNPTRTDLVIVRYGIVPLLVIVAEFGPALLRLLGIGS